MTDELHALHASASRLREQTTSLPLEELTRPAYPTEWTIADVLSHLGSGAVITHRRLDDAVAERDTSDDFAQEVWDRWNAKDPVAQRDDALAADAALLERLDAITPAEQAAFTSAMGPFTLGFGAFVGMRLSEHALHVWDIEVVRNPAAVLQPETVTQLVDNLEFIARFAAKPFGEVATVQIATTDPARAFTIDLEQDAVTLRSTTPTDVADLVLPAEAFVRLVYGRLDPAHTPGDHSPLLDTLRRVFPGF